MKKLRTIDLFSGCGGAALGLRRFSKVVAYCEQDPECVRVLQKNMQLGHLDKAPIVRDVQKFPADLVDVDLISSGFPCVSVSRFGNREGFQGESGLFLAMMKIIDHYLPSYCFFENVDNLRSMPHEWRTVLKRMNSAGYDCWWAIVSASNCGAHHRRKRWFLGARRRGTTLSISIPPIDLELNRPWNYHTFKFSKTSGTPWEPKLARLIKHGDMNRLRMCGNICVPLQATLAFSIVFGGMIKPVRKIGMMQHNIMPSTGCYVNGVLYESDPLPLKEPRKLNLVFRYSKEPGHFRKHRNELPMLEGEKTFTRWSTPRAKAGHIPVRALTSRTIRDLAVQLRFEKGTKESEQWNKLVNPLWLEWLSGLPSNFTQ